MKRVPPSQVIPSLSTTPKLKLELARRTATELASISVPCYYTKLKPNYLDLLSLCGVSPEEVETALQDFYRDSKVQEDWKIERNPFSFLLLVLATYYLFQKDRNMYRVCLQHLAVNNYSNFMYSNLRYCSADVYRSALLLLPKNHLFQRFKSVGKAIQYIADSVSEKYETKFLQLGGANPDLFSLVLRELRSRIASSLKSFLRVYYALKRGSAGTLVSGISFSGEEEEKEGVYGSSREVRLFDEAKRRASIAALAEKMTVYGSIDEKAFSEARSRTQLGFEFCKTIVRTLSSASYTQNVKIILSYLFEDLKREDLICNLDIYQYVKKVMGVRYTKKPIYFKQQVLVLSDSILKEIKKPVSSQTKYLVNLFLALYVVYFTRNRICPSF